MLVTRNGMSIRFSEKDVRDMGRTAMGVKGITLGEGDTVVSMSLAQDVMLVTRNGMSIRFSEKDVRDMGRTAMGVKGITLGEGDTVVSMSLASEGTDMLVVSENGFGKRTLYL